MANTFLAAVLRWKLVISVTVLLTALLSPNALSQRLGPEPGPGRGLGRNRLISERGPASREGVPEWEVMEKFRRDVFTFVRVIYTSRRGGGWRVDHPAADLNFSYRLEELTSMKVDPDGETLRLLDDRLFDYPFIFMIDPRSLHISRGEAEVLRTYLLNGGFLMVDDFWGENMMEHFLGEMEKVFPDRKPVTLPLSHPIFSCVFPLEKFPQVPSEDSAHRNKGTAVESWEDEIYWEMPQPADYQAIVDDKGRIMVLMCHNTDLSDGWEEEGISQWFFSAYSEKYSYPMGINIVYYALTH
ncbi:MAG: hypothetical protein M2R45_02325 [Verrucomicrobia subdivision 3 bacterium]|nr:hypothetical protein [Limisphaerales bacterium]MCS1414704.1 hypothetical protein [Limisphaerales bacterium]